jgi:hypothetical protein
MRINPKIKEKPADSRNKSPPSERLFRLWINQNAIGLSNMDRSDL